MNKNIIKFFAVLVMCFMIGAVLVACQGETGPQGAQGVKGDQGEKGETGAAGANGQNGKDGKDGKDGLGIASVVINEAGELVITYTDGTSANLGNVVGEKGEDAFVCTNHDFVSIEISDTVGAYYTLEVCNTCGWAQIGCAHNNYVTTYTPATCETAGFTTYECNACDHVWVVEDLTAPAFGHKLPAFDEADPSATGWTLDINNSGLCDCEWERTYTALCANGCGADVHTTGTAIGHVYGPWEDTTNNSNACDCEWIPIQIAPCTRCNHDTCFDSQEIGTAKGHKWGNWLVVTAPTADAEGEAIRICETCGADHEVDGTDSIVLPKLDTTNYVYSVINAEACAVDGKATYTYTYTDGTTIVIEVVLPATGHTYTSGVVTKLPGRPTELTGEYTLEEMDAHIASFNGTVKMTCDVCGETHEEEIPAITAAMGRFIIAFGNCVDRADTYSYHVIFADEITGEQNTIVVEFQVDGLYEHDHAPAQEECQKVDGVNKTYWVYKCQKCGNWIVAYYESK